MVYDGARFVSSLIGNPNNVMLLFQDCNCK